MNITEQIEKIILSNLTPRAERKIGVEFEAIIYNRNNRRILVTSEKEISSESIIAELEKKQSSDDTKAGYTIEPGGQIEWASPPMKTLNEIGQNLNLHKNRLQSIVDREGLLWIDYSVEPKYLPSEISLIDNEKYRLMDKRFRRTGNLGSWMMRNTVSVQINIDYSSREEAEKMAFIADCITPLASILFANGPFWMDSPAGSANLRYKIWGDTDSDRCGDLLDHGIVTDNFLIHNYSEYIQTVPAIFVYDARGNVVEYSGTLGDWFNELSAENRLTGKEIQLGLHQIFTHVRFKNVLEIRACDRPPLGYELAPVAFWVGLLLDERTLKEVYEIVKSWSIHERNKLKESAFFLDLKQQGPQNHNLKDWINKLIALSLAGLYNRSKQYGIEEEKQYLIDYIDFFYRNGIPAIYAQSMKK